MQKEKHKIEHQATMSASIDPSKNKWYEYLETVGNHLKHVMYNLILICQQQRESFLLPCKFELYLQ